VGKQLNNITQLMIKLSKNAIFLPGSIVRLNIRDKNRQRVYKAYYLSYSKRGRTCMIYIPKEEIKEVKELIRRYKRVKKILEKIKELNIKYFKERRKLR